MLNPRAFLKWRVAEKPDIFAAALRTDYRRSKRLVSKGSVMASTSTDVVLNFVTHPRDTRSAADDPLPCRTQP